MSYISEQWKALAFENRFLSRLAQQSPLFYVVSAYICIALMVDPVSQALMTLEYLKGSLAFSFFIANILVAITVINSFKDHSDSPLKFFLTTFIEMLRRILPMAAMLGLFLAAFTTLKVYIPRFIPFYADPLFADMDKWLHGGEVWQITHQFADKIPGFDTFIAHSYSFLVWGTQWFGVFLLVAAWKNNEAKKRYLWSFTLSIIICGTVLAYLLSSVGPIFYPVFYGNDAFTGLLPHLQEGSAYWSILNGYHYLLDNYTNSITGSGTGISAMPSVHVTVVTLNAWLYTTINKKLAILGWLYVAIILFGSMYTGWHYAVDGYLAIIVVTAIWFGVTRCLTGHWAGHKGIYPASKLT